jgi:hypothetical protein
MGKDLLFVLMDFSVLVWYSILSYLTDCVRRNPPHEMVARRCLLVCGRYCVSLG